MSISRRRDKQRELITFIYSQECQPLKPLHSQSLTRTQPATLKGWQQIAAFLGEPISVVQRWAAEGMPVKHEGRFVSTTPDQLNAWMGKESGKPVHVVTQRTDLSAELKRGLSFVRNEKQSNKRNPRVKSKPKAR